MVIKYQPRYHNSWALIIGINAYQHVNPLSHACNDADAIAAVLMDELDFPRDHVIILKDHKATKQAILEAYLNFREKANDPDDRVLMFFAGHGTTEQGHRGPIGFLIPVDGSRDNLSTLIRWDDLIRNAELIPAKHILFIMDACYSGLALQRAIPPGPQRFFSDMLQRFARQVITAGKADETVADGGGPQGMNSIFTGYLLDGLHGAAADKYGVLTANGLMNYVYQKVGQDSRSQQTPHYGHIDGDGDFILRTPNRGHLELEPKSDSPVGTVMEMPEATLSLAVPGAEPSFAEKNGYSDPGYPSFGRNDWSNKLGEQRFYATRDNEVTKAFSWLSLIVEPTVNQSVAIDIDEEITWLRQLNLPGDEPYKQFSIPQQAKTTIDSVILFDRFNDNSDFWKYYLRIDKTGNIEYADSNLLMVGELDGIRYFGYVEMIGRTWQFIFLAKHLLANAGYKSDVRLLVNLVGTRDSALIDFSHEPGKGDKRWLQPFKSDAFGRTIDLSDLKCPNLNLQLRYDDIIIGDVSDGKARDIINKIARELGRAYNHQSSPRCFNYNSDVFPWKQYLDRHRY